MNQNMKQKVLEQETGTQEAMEREVLSQEAIRALKAMNVLDDFLFWKLTSDPELGPEFSRQILQVILKRELRQLKVIPQKVYYGSSPDKHGARLDVYIEENGTAETEASNVFDIEPDQNNKKRLIEALPKRVRFYHAKIDGESLEAGLDYDQLKHVAVIMITSYDPFGYGRMLYTVRTLCAEEPEMPYDDGAVTLFLYTRGTKGDPPEELRQLLSYMEQSDEEHVKSEALHSIHQMVQKVKYSKEVSLEYMKIYEREQMIREEGEAKGEIKGEFMREIRMISRMLSKNKSLQEMMELSELEETKLKTLIELIKKYPEEDSRQIMNRYQEMAAVKRKA